jgi:hypothetical protein
VPSRPYGTGREGSQGGAPGSSRGALAAAARALLLSGSRGRLGSGIDRGRDGDHAGFKLYIMMRK